jgi:hypothetical protein
MTNLRFSVCSHASSALFPEHRQTEKMIMIVDGNEGFHWTLMPNMKMYLKTKIKAQKQ